MGPLVSLLGVTGMYLSIEMKASKTLPCLPKASMRMSLLVFQERLPT